MELEQRVKVLEQELKILKNQVQMTLLDIEEHVLTGSYPSLRAETLSTQTPQMYAPASANGNGKSAEQQAEAQSVSSMPTIRKVKLSDLETNTENETKTTAVEPSPLPAMSRTDWDSLDQLTQWAIQNIETLGITRTRKLIDVYASQGLLTPEVGTALAQIAAIFDDTTMETGDSAEEASDSDGQEDTGVRAAGHENKANLIVRLINHLKQSSSEQGSNNG